MRKRAGEDAPEITSADVPAPPQRVASHVAAPQDVYCVNCDLPCLKLLRKLLLSLGHSCQERAQCENLIGHHYQLTAEPALGIPFFERAADIFAKLEDKLNEARTRTALAEFLDTLGQQEYAEEQAAKAEILRRGSANFSGEPTQASGEDVMMVEQRFRDAREERLRAGDGVAVCSLSDRILMILSERGDTMALIKELELAVALGERMRPGSIWLGVKKIELAQAYLDCDNADAAEDPLIDACALMTQHNDHEGLMTVTLTFAVLRGVQSRFSEGVELAEAAARLCRQRGQEVPAANCDAMAETLRLKLKAELDQ